MNLSTLFLAALIVFAAIGIIALLALAIWYFVLRPIDKAFEPESFVESLGETWGDTCWDICLMNEEQS